MKKWIGLIILIIALLLPVSSHALSCGAGTATTYSNKDLGGGVWLWQVSYVTHSSAGTFTCDTDNDITCWRVIVETDPVTTAPDDNYTVALNNANGRDVMGGAMSANRDTANTEAVMPLLNGNYTVIWNEGPLSIAVILAGNSKTAELLIYYLAAQ